MQSWRCEKSCSSYTMSYKGPARYKYEVMNKGKKFLKIFAAGVVCLLLLGAIIMLLWNWLVPQLFNGPQIGFVEALGLFALSKILFGSWGGGKCKNGGAHSWKSRYYDKLSSMTPEDRERFKKRMSEKWCSGGHKDTPAGTSID